MKTIEADDEGIKRCAEIIKKGGVVIYPTDTLFGLGADIFNPDAVRRVFEIKRRSPDKPVSAAFASLEDAKDVVDISKAGKYAKLLPGPYTLLLPAKKKILGLTHEGKIGIRVPEHEIALKLLGVSGPITATSANLSGGNNPARLEDIPEEVLKRVDVCLSGKTVYGKGSVIIDCVTGKSVRD